MNNDKFVLSSTPFPTIKKAEKVVNGWQGSGQLRDTNVRLFKVVEVYDLKLKFVKRKNK